MIAINLDSLLTSAIELTALAFIALPLLRLPYQLSQAIKLTRMTEDTLMTDTSVTEAASPQSEESDDWWEIVEVDALPSKSLVSEVSLPPLLLLPSSPSNPTVLPPSWVFDLPLFIDWSDADLLALAKEQGIKATKRWKRETLISKLQASI